MKHKTGFGVLLFLLILVALVTGRYGAGIQDILHALMFQGDAITQSLVWNIRMPRILLVCVSGSALALSGVIYQTIFKNPLASGDVIGVSSGCSLGAVIAILLCNTTWMIEAGSFLAGIVTVMMTIFLAQRVKGNRILNLVIAGLIMQAISSSVMMVLKIQADPYHELASIEYWLMGGFSDASWSQVWLTVTIVFFCTVGLYLLRWQIQMLSFGEEAQNLGIAAKKIRMTALLLSTLLISAVISVAGIVSWVGLLVPHIIRLMKPQPLSKSIGLIVLCGSCFLLLCDTLARSLFVIELPISILTSFFGALFLIVLFLKGRFPI